MTIDLAAIKEQLKAYAQSVGLDLIGVAGADPFRVDEERLVARKEKGFGPNPYEPQEIKPRVEPEQLLPGVQSIISAGISYLVESTDDNLTDGSVADGPRGWLSRYCRGQDYHQVLKEALRQVAAWIEESVPGAKTLVYVDTGPPLERSYAERAGVGKWGKSTMLISPPYGTWTFLGSILTTLPLPPDEPIEAACGTCTLCIDACPTGALHPWELEANQCLSYVTQMKGIIPAEFREVMGNRLFGCDDCQDVCPYNKRARRVDRPSFHPHPEVGGEPNLLQLMAMTKSDFRRWFEPTAAGWRGKTTIQRNAIIALGNSGDPAGLPSLVQALQNDSAVIRAHAGWALGRLARLAPAVQAEVRTALMDGLARETDGAAQLEMTGALESLGA
ncbi:MAG TPA: tRNA epoxyqueuosine(34) reductase QueG [Symbiobacteriaceae bacterium]|nr:tRNA epoxyqueuosine(34) reductase QueG [Symbiobacteriaceae bacterium]